MIKTLVIYDNYGKIFSQVTGDYIKPSGLQHLEVEVPQNKTISGVEVSVSPHRVILEDIPPSETDLLRIETAESNAELFELIFNMQTGGM